jgi:hypothetical protein
MVCAFRSHWSVALIRIRNLRGYLQPPTLRRSPEQGTGHIRCIAGLQSVQVHVQVKRGTVITQTKFRTWNTRYRYSAVSIATGYGLDGREVGVRVPVGENFSSVRVVQADFAAEADPLSPASVQIKSTWIYTSTPPYVFMA